MTKELQSDKYLLRAMSEIRFVRTTHSTTIFFFDEFVYELPITRYFAKLSDIVKPTTRFFLETIAFDENCGFGFVELFRFLNLKNDDGNNYIRVSKYGHLHEMSRIIRGRVRLMCLYILSRRAQQQQHTLSLLNNNNNNERFSMLAKIPNLIWNYMLSQESTDVFSYIAGRDSIPQLMGQEAVDMKKVPFYITNSVKKIK